MSKVDLSLNSGQALVKGKIIQASIGISKGKIAKISSSKIPAKKEINCAGKIILSGAIDAHVHFRTPGAEQKEDWITGSKSAVAGGITTVFDMPNNNPAMDSIEKLAEKRKLIEKQNPFVNYGLFIAATNNNAEELKKNKFYPVKYYLGETTGKIVIDDAKAIEKGFKILKRKKIPCFIHGESNKVIEENKRNISGNSVLQHNKIRSIGAEIESIEFALRIWRNIENKIHFTHVSSPQAVELIEEEKSRSRNAKKLISFDVTPHHLFLNDSMLSSLKNYGKMNPPLRNQSQQEKMLELLLEGKIDFVFSDHAPHLKSEKEQDYANAPSGIPGVQTMLPLLLNEAVNGKISFEKINEITSSNPAKLMGLKSKGEIKKGFDADLTVFDPNKETEIKEKELFYKCGWSAFEGMKLKGKIDATIVNGAIAFDKEKFFEKKGKFVCCG